MEHNRSPNFAITGVDGVSQSRTETSAAIGTMFAAAEVTDPVWAAVDTTSEEAF